MRGVRIQNDGGLVMVGTTITDAENGTEIKGVCGITVTFKPDDVVRAEIELCAVALDSGAEARFLVAHPETGEMKAVSETTFADGSKVSL